MPLSKTKFGLTTFQLKLIALICMTIDHFGAYAYQLPVFGAINSLLRIIGRISAPLFLFTVVQGVMHTHSRSKYLLRLYLSGVCVAILDGVIYVLWGKDFGLPAFGNIFFTFFFAVLYIVLAETLLKGIRTKCFRSVLAALAGFAASLAPSLILKLFDLAFTGILPPDVFTLSRKIFSAFFPLLPYVQYGAAMVALGVVMYFAGTKTRQCVVFVVFCLLCTAAAFAKPLLPGWTRYFLGNAYSRIQCWMILALPFMLLYNGERGKSGKWLFYIYYPVHRYIIAIAAIVLG